MSLRCLYTSLFCIYFAFKANTVLLEGNKLELHDKFGLYLLNLTNESDKLLYILPLTLHENLVGFSAVTFVILYDRLGIHMKKRWLL